MLIAKKTLEKGRLKRVREFKFRAWRHDGEYSHMIESPIGVYTALKHCLGVATSAGFSDCPNEPRKDGYTLMQCIGRKDKNGREIYECDIVQYRTWAGVFIGVVHIGEYSQDGSGGEYDPVECFGAYIQRVKAIPNEEYHCSPDWEDTISIFEPEDIEKIGNIFENQELLEVSE